MLDKLVAALMIAAVPQPANAPPVPVPSIELPIPYEYRGSPNYTVKLRFKENYWAVEDECGRIPGMTVLACYLPDEGTLILPNPCYYPEAGTPGTFAHLLCHEKAHVNGWRH